jgi:branched-chain amino acid transport system ATP-binding protein
VADVEPPLLAVSGISKRFGGLTALADISLAVRRGEIFGLIGPNGAGKTTLFNVVTGLYRADAGSFTFNAIPLSGAKPHQVAASGIARTFQNIRLFANMSALENVMVGRHVHEVTDTLSDLLHLPSVGLQNRNTRKSALAALVRVGLADHADRPASSLAYGSLRRLEIARALATEPRLLLLDEPAAGCNPIETQQLEGIIRQIAEDGVTVVLVEHDMRLVMNISDRIHVLANGRTLAEGTAAQVRANPAVVDAYLGTHGLREAALALD